MIERFDRLADDLDATFPQIHDYRFLHHVFPGHKPDLRSDAPRKLMRQIMGTIAEYDKAMIVAKLRVARERISKNSRWEVAKPFGLYDL